MTKAYIFSLFLISCKLGTPVQNSQIFNDDFEVGKTYRQSLEIAYEIAAIDDDKTSLLNPYDPLPKGFVVYDGKIDKESYASGFYLINFISDNIFKIIDSFNIKQISDFELQSLDSAIISNKNLETKFIKNNNLKISKKSYEYTYKIVKVEVESIYIGEQEINKPLFIEDKDSTSCFLKSKIFLPVKITLQ